MNQRPTAVLITPKKTTFTRGLVVLILVAVWALAGCGSSSHGAASAAGASTNSANKGNCSSPPGSDQGVTTSQIKLALLLFAAGPGGAANTAFGLPTLAQQQSQSTAVANAINSSGGVACRQLALQYFTANVIDPPSLQKTCLDVASAGVFAVVDPGAYNVFPTLAGCYPQHQLPYFSDTGLTSAEASKYFPYMFGGSLLETTYKDTVFELKNMGFFDKSKGFAKLGLLYNDCTPALVTAFEKELSDAGVANGDVVPFDVGCPTLTSAPSTLQQAILKFKQNGVTNVSYVQEFADWIVFTKLAQQQDFHPQYGLPDENLIADGIQGPQKPDYTNMTNAVAISPYRDGDQNAGGSVGTGTGKCNAILSAAAQPNVYQYVGSGGLFCDILWEFQRAADHAPSLTRSQLADGLQAAKTVDFSYPEGPNDFSKPKTTVGGEFWRVLKFSPGCNCFQAQGNFQRSL